MTETLIVERVSARTLFKILFIGFLTIHVATSLVATILVVVGVLPLESAEELSVRTSLFAVAAYLFFGIVTSPIWVGVFWLSLWPGLWIYSLIRPMKIRYVPTHADPHT